MVPEAGLAAVARQNSPQHTNWASGASAHRGATCHDDTVIPTALERTTRDLDIHVAAGGWNQPTRLFAIAQTAQLLEREPSLGQQLTGTADESPWTTIEQDGLPPHSDLDDLLGGLGWPESVDGVAVSAERIMVSPEDADQQAQHELRLTMAVLRDGTRCTVLRLREHDSPETVIVGEDLISGLGDLLLHTLS